MPDLAFRPRIGRRLVTNRPARRRFWAQFRGRASVIQRIHRALVGARDPAGVPAKRRRSVGVAELGAHVGDGRPVLGAGSHRCGGDQDRLDVAAVQRSDLEVAEGREDVELQLLPVGLHRPRLELAGDLAQPALGVLLDRDVAVDGRRDRLPGLRNARAVVEMLPGVAAEIGEGLLMGTWTLLSAPTMGCPWRVSSNVPPG